MSEVTRYRICGTHSGYGIDAVAEACPVGDFVLHSDYADLEVERDALEAANAELTKRLEEAERVKAMAELTRHRACERAANAEQQLATLTAQLAAAEGERDEALNKIEGLEVKASLEAGEFARLKTCEDAWLGVSRTIYDHPRCQQLLAEQSFTNAARQWAAEACRWSERLDFLKSRGLTVTKMKDQHGERLVYVIAEGSELCDKATLDKLFDAELKLAAAEAERDRFKASYTEAADNLSFIQHYLDNDSDQRTDWEFLDPRWRQLAYDTVKQLTAAQREAAELRELVEDMRNEASLSKLCPAHEAHAALKAIRLMADEALARLAATPAPAVAEGGGE